MSSPVRLAKRVTEIAACSRRDAESYITDGWVSVDGAVVELPQFMVSDQIVTLHPKASLKPTAPVTILLNKPEGCFPDEPNDEARLLLTLGNQIEDDRSNIQLLHKHLKNLHATFSLETNGSGLLVYSQDRSIVRKLIDDAKRIEQEFVVGVAGDIARDGLERLNKGFYCQGVLIPPMKVSWQNETHLRFAAKGLRVGQLADICDVVGLDVTSIKRVRIGRISMGQLPVGQWRFLLGYERF